MVLEELSELKKQGLRAIPLTSVIPDAIIIDFENRRVYAFELETSHIGRNDLESYIGVKCFDDVIWVKRKR